MKTGYDKVLITISMGVLFCSAAGYLISSSQRRVSRELPEIPQVDNPYLPVDPAGLSEPSGVWNAPPSQSWDPKAIFEVFTPPLIYYQKEANTFSLTPPLLSEGIGGDFGIELVGIERKLYRIQLGGFTQGPALVDSGPIVLLYNLETRELLRAHRGQRFAQDQFTLLDFRTRKYFEKQQDGTRLLFNNATCLILDERLNEEVTLSTAGKRLTRRAEAIFKATGNSSLVLKTIEGEIFEIDGQKFIVHEINPESRTVEVEKISGVQNKPEIQILTMAQVSLGDKSSFQTPK